jgi:hypothetical protein
MPRNIETSSIGRVAIGTIQLVSLLCETLGIVEENIWTAIRIFRRYLIGHPLWKSIDVILTEFRTFRYPFRSVSSLAISPAEIL